MEMIELYHGTSSVHEATILAGGLSRPFATRSLDLAEYYAQCACDDDGGEPIILGFKVALTACGPDHNALAEPVVSSIDDIEATCEEDVHAMLEAWTGDIDATCTLQLVASCLVNADVPAGQLWLVE